MNAKNEDNFLHGLATNVKTSLTKQHAAFTFESVHVRSLQIYEYFMVANYKYYIHNDTPCSKSKNDFFCILYVWFGFQHNVLNCYIFYIYPVV